jgi:uncharacterized protein YutE (UPF0331/DUF86 family)
MIDGELVTRKLVLICADLPDLRTLATTARADYLATRRDQLVAERLLERVIGRMIDVNYHLLTESGAPPPRDFHEAFTELAKLGVLDSAFTRRIASVAGLRNRIAHEYDTIDHTKVHEAVAAAVVDVPVYVRGVQDFVQRQAPPQR